MWLSFLPTLYIDLISQSGLLIQIIIGSFLSALFFFGIWLDRTKQFIRRVWEAVFRFGKTDNE